MGHPEFFLHGFQIGLIEGGIHHREHAAGETRADGLFHLAVDGETRGAHLALLLPALELLADARIPSLARLMAIEHDEVDVIGVQDLQGLVYVAEVILDGEVDILAPGFEHIAERHDGPAAEIVSRNVDKIHAAVDGVMMNRFHHHQPA